MITPAAAYWYCMQVLHLCRAVACGTQRSYHLGNVTQMVSYAAYKMPVFPGRQRKREMHGTEQPDSNQQEMAKTRNHALG